MFVDLYAYLTNLPRWHIFAIFLVGYLFYYLMEVVKVSWFFVCLLQFHCGEFSFAESSYLIVRRCSLGNCRTFLYLSDAVAHGIFFSSSVQTFSFEILAVNRIKTMQRGNIFKEYGSNLQNESFMWENLQAMFHSRDGLATI